MLDAQRAARLREALSIAGYHQDGLRARLSGLDDDAEAVLEVLGDTPLGTLVALFCYGQAVRADRLSHALRPLSLDDAVDAGLVQVTGAGVRATVYLTVYENWWLLADLATGLPQQPGADFVIADGPAASMLATATLRQPVGAALDMFTGGGVQSLHLSAHAGTVTGTDLSPRALRYAATTAALNGLDWELLQGDMSAPVAGRRFDLVVANPPFTLKPGPATYLYRDSGRQGDGISASVVGGAGDLLAEGGHLQCLASWAHLAGQHWTERVAGWTAGTGCDAWVVEYEAHDPDAYVAMWATEDDTPQVRNEWTSWLRHQDIEAIGWGWIMLRNSGHAEPSFRADSLPGQQITGPAVADWFARQDWLRTHRNLLAARYIAADRLTLRTDAALDVTAGRWQITRHLLTVPGEPARTEYVSRLVAALVEGCDGSQSLREQLAKLAASRDVDPAGLIDAAGQAVPRLVEHGYLRPVGL